MLRSNAMLTFAMLAYILYFTVITKFFTDYHDLERSFFYDLPDKNALLEWYYKELNRSEDPLTNEGFVRLQSIKPITPKSLEEKKQKESLNKKKVKVYP